MEEGVDEECNGTGEVDAETLREDEIEGITGRHDSCIGSIVWLAILLPVDEWDKTCAQYRSDNKCQYRSDHLALSFGGGVHKSNVLGDIGGNDVGAIIREFRVKETFLESLILSLFHGVFGVGYAIGGFIVFEIKAFRARIRST